MGVFQIVNLLIFFLQMGCPKVWKIEECVSLVVFVLIWSKGFSQRLEI